MISRRDFLQLGVVALFAGMEACNVSLSAFAANSGQISLLTNDAAPAPAGGAIDRQALVSRHKIVRTTCDENNPVQLGNGHFAIGVDITGLQTFLPFNTMSDWGWHSFPLAPGQKLADYKGGVWDTHGRPVTYCSPDPNQPALSQWLYDNPHRINLGRIALKLIRSDGSEAAASDLTGSSQELDLWTGVLRSQFEFDGAPVNVETSCHPSVDSVAVKVVSPLVAAGRLSAFIDFPCDDGREFVNFVGDWNNTKKHKTLFNLRRSRIDIVHQQDAASYHVSAQVQGNVAIQPPASHVPSAPLRIKSAEYGAGDHFVDVTSVVAAAVDGDLLQIDVDNAQFGGDPSPGHVKTLVVRYAVGSRDFEKSASEGDTLSIGDTLLSHRFGFLAKSGDTLEFTCAFAPDALPRALPDANATFDASSRYWPEFWKSGGAIDLSQSKDPRWFELERRIVLSQYVMAVNEAGSMPPQESGLVNNGWNGKFHMEMYWWHAAHYALWNRWDLLDRSLDIYREFLPSSRERARNQGFKGARWPKMTCSDGHEAAHPCNALLIWQQPHPIFFAELDYRAHPTRETLDKWKEIVFSTADFLSSFAFLDPNTSRYVLGPPIYIVSENTDPKISTNPTFELSYWRFGLRNAQIWRDRLGMERNEEWERVLKDLAPLPEEDGAYVTYEGVPDMWTKYNFEHPALTGVYGLLPGDGVDVATMRRTAEKVFTGWQFNHTWGWDYPMLAMCAARLGEAEKAMDFLLTASTQFDFSDVGLAKGGPYPYMPSNGGLLYAVALMAAGWDGDSGAHAPGFPQDGSWTVRCEGLSRAI